MDRPGATIERVGGYRVVRRLATGGTADVLLAKAEGPHGFERTVVLKLLLSQYRNDEEFARMFAREAAAYARLSHPSIVQLHDFFALEGQLVMVLEYVDGPPLSRLRGMLKAVGQQLDDTASIYVAAQLFSALAAAHATCDEAGNPAPVIHRDVNPSNVLIPWDGQVKLADFGVAKVTGLAGESRVGMLKGTFGYMAPEQIDGTAVTPRADVYAGGIILWELLTRRRAFLRGALPEVEVLRQMAEPKIVSIDVLRPDVDRNVRDAIRRALEPVANKRRITAEEMVSVLRAAVAPDVGREHLASALASVRHEPRASMTSVPPPDAEPPTLGGATPPPVPRPAAVPRAEIALRRTPTPPPARVQTPPPVRALADERASLVPSTVPMPSSRPEVRFFDTHVEPPELVAVTGRDSEKLRIPTPVAALAASKEAGAAIDDILRDIPSSIPPATFRGGRRSSRPDRDDDATIEPVASPAVGERAVFVADETAASEAEAMDHTVAMVGAPQLPSPSALRGKTQHAFPPPPQPFQGTTAPMPAVPAPPHTLPFVPDPRPASIAPPPAAAAASSLAPPPALAPPPPIGPAPGNGPHPMSVAPPAIAQPITSSLSGAAAPSDAYPSLAPPRRRVGMAIVAGVVSVLALAGIATTVGYRRWHGSVPTAATATTTAAATVTAPATASAAAPASASASASAPASASASASASAPAPAVASAEPAQVELPPGTGLLTTAGFPKGHRIYVDGHVVGQTPDEVRVKCGRRAVRIGSGGKAKPVFVRCGGVSNP